jgi:ElaB/YqjD/DUF883 family membrane-anchored ribosome-binding protein
VRKAATVSRPSSKYGREDSDVGQSTGSWSKSDEQRFVAANTQSSGCSWLGCVAQAAGGVVNTIHNAAGSAVQWVRDHPDQAIALAAASVAFVAACVAACEVLVGGALLMADSTTAGAGLTASAQLACAAACASLITVGPSTIGLTSALLVAVTGDSKYDVGDVPDISTPEFRGEVRSPLTPPGMQVHWEK